MGAQLVLKLDTGRPPRLARRGWVPGIPVHPQPPPESDPGEPESWEAGAMRWAPQLLLPLDEPPDRRRSLIRS